MWFGVTMWILGALLGIALTICVGLHLHLRRISRILENPTPDFSASGSVFRADRGRLAEVLDGVFPNAPARAYVTVSDMVCPYEGIDSDRTSFYVRSAGKRQGTHRFRAELRISADDRERLARAEAVMRGLCLDVERIEKSYGSVWLQSGTSEDRRVFEDAAQGFLERVLGLSAQNKVTLIWHIPGRPGT